MSSYHAGHGKAHEAAPGGKFRVLAVIALLGGAMAAPTMAEAGSSAPVPAAPPKILTKNLVTPAAVKEQAKLCSNGGFPAQWTWDAALTTHQPRPATSGTPRIEQWRNRTLVATYSALGDDSSNPKCTIAENSAQKPSVSQDCGAFGRAHRWRMWLDGDVFVVYPAVYEGSKNQPWIGPLADNAQEWNSGIFHTPTNLTIVGVVVHGERPVLRGNSEGVSYTTYNQGLIYLDVSKNIKIQELDIDAGTLTVPGKAGIYVNGADTLSIIRSRIHGFNVGDVNAGENGIFGTPNNAGVLTLDQVQLYDNGGNDGPAHNIYINPSDTDPNFTVHMTNSWSHDALYGHTFKSRAQINILEGNYLQGGKPNTAKGFTQAENYLVDIPNGGRLTMRNNILVKNASGPNSNAMSITYAMEGIPDKRKLAVVIENNSFVAFDRSYDGLHPLFPMAFFYPLVSPADPKFPLKKFTKFSVSKNAFVGYCPSTDPVLSYRGTLALTEAFSETKRDFTLTNKYISRDSTVIGTRAYKHEDQPGQRRTAATIGARD